MRPESRTTNVSAIEPAPWPRQEAPADRARELRLKHAIDRVAALTLIVLLAPALVLIAAVVKLAGPGPVLVRDRRIDRDGRSFDMRAFRPLPFLRRWPLDRLPELFNIVRGEMSFVGPRPERPEFVELFGENLRRHDQPLRVRPGITGWAQVRGLEGRAPLAERVRWDDLYAENWSLWLDVKIVFATIVRISAG